MLYLSVHSASVRAHACIVCLGCLSVGLDSYCLFFDVACQLCFVIGSVFVMVMLDSLWYVDWYIWYCLGLYGQCRYTCAIPHGVSRLSLCCAAVFSASSVELCR